MFFLLEVIVCDSMMGTGKTTSAINYMNEQKDQKFIFITPYLTEVERIKTECAERNFKDPINFGDGKLQSLHRLLKEGHNICSTHALFSKYNEETKKIISEQNYILILDEVFNVIERVSMNPSDIDVLVESNLITIGEDGIVKWIKDDYKGSIYRKLKTKSSFGSLISYNKSLLFWNYPVSIFQAFNKIIILTYMFRAQIQCYYYQVNEIEVKYIGTKYENGTYYFSDTPFIPDYAKGLKNKIHILHEEWDDHPIYSQADLKSNLNNIGKGRYDLSATWYEKEKNRRGRPVLNQLKRNVENILRNKYNAKTNEIMWTTFKDYKNFLKGRGYTKGFVPCNIRATNDYKDRIYLAYCVNIFFNPAFKGYFKSKGIKTDENLYALSEMIQWIWRSGIREGKDIWIYIPSRRMRNLLKNWLMSFEQK